MSYGLSIDVGTSFTAAAVLRTGSQGPEEPAVLPLGGRGTSIPTVVFVGSDGSRFVGEVAERRGLAEPGNVAREFKRRIGDSVPLVLGGTAILPEDLFAVMVDWVVGVATEREGEPPASITLTHPAGWGEHRTSLLKGALAASGYDDVVLMTEPEAAALSYAARERVSPGSTLAVYDLGGGTFDATVVRKADADTFTVLGTPQGIERLGGADFDQEVFNRVLDDADVSLAWEDQSSPEVLAALNRLRRECAEAKEALSSDSEATVSIMIPGSHSQVRLVRAEFELMVEPALRETIETMRLALESAGVRAEDLSAILLIGGSSRIPLVAQLLSAEFNRPLAIDVDPKASVALGAAFATAALEDGEDSAQPVPAAAAGEGASTGRRRAGVNAAGFSVAARPGSATPHHGPAGKATNKRLGFRVGAIVSAVTLLGVATATATNAPNPFTAAISTWAGDPRADAAEEPGTTPATPVPLAAPGAPDAPVGAGVGPLADTGAALQDKLFGVGAGSAAAAPGAAATPTPGATRAGKAAGTSAPSAEPRSGAAPASGASGGAGGKTGTGAAGPSVPPVPPSSPAPSPTGPTTNPPTTNPPTTNPPTTPTTPDPTVPPTTPPTTNPPVTPDPTLPPVTPTTPPTTNPPVTPPVTPEPTTVPIDPTTPPAPVTPPPTTQPVIEPTAVPGPPADPPAPGAAALALSVTAGI
ncbi:Hsp70 family protein [Arthrobacter agilis]|uniref:Hsp70 family protein n=1 Tax=Arthrobacter agilis TaxID=37921 RepID=UPI002782423A|nr:Hsp70 family protein [Arthrobacter agilis]MDQ0734028.1 molecular chaperone DnaK [Arthrobacter agilis]